MQQDSQSNLQIPNCRLIFDRMDLRFHFHFAQFFLSSPFVLFCQLCHFLHSSHFMHTWLQLNTRYTCCIMAMFCYLFFSLSYVSVSFLHHQRHSKNADFHAAHSTASSNVKYVACSAKRKTRKKWKWTNMAANSFACSTCHFSFFSFFLSLSLLPLFAEFFFFWFDSTLQIHQTDDGFIKYLEWFLIVGMIAA